MIDKYKYNYFILLGCGGHFTYEPLTIRSSQSEMTEPRNCERFELSLLAASQSPVGVTLQHSNQTVKQTAIHIPIR